MILFFACVGAFAVGYYVAGAVIECMFQRLEQKRFIARLKALGTLD